MDGTIVATVVPCTVTILLGGGWAALKLAAKIGNIEGKCEGMDKRLDGVDSRLDNIDERINNVIQNK